jgi:protein involved in polysaccharide export with SLBB domain
VGSIRVEGSTPAEVAAALTQRLRGIIVDARVAVWLARSAAIRVKVVGAVKTPGVVELGRDRSVLGALASAGWLGEFADPEAIYVIREPGQPRIRFRLQDLTSAQGRSARFRLQDGDAVVVD